MQSQRSVSPVLSGPIPPLADGYIPREGGVPGLGAAPTPGEVVLLTPDGSSVPGGWTGPGTGKTQLAAAHARSLLAGHAVGLVAWVPAGSRDAIITGYAQALADVSAGAPPLGRAELAAGQFLDSLAQDAPPWLIVLDGLVREADADGLWPRGPAGQVVVTTELAAPRLPGHRAAPVTVFSPREAASYLLARLHDDSTQQVGALDLAADLGHVPLTLSLAAAYLLDTRLSCWNYRRIVEPAGQRADGGGDVAAALSATAAAALDRASRLPPAGVARMATALAIMYGPHGIPTAALTSPAACAFLTGRDGADPEAQEDVRAAYGNLARLGLVTIDAADQARTVRMHGLLQDVLRQALAPAERAAAAAAAAEALLQAWPAHDVPLMLDQALRDCAASLASGTRAGDASLAGLRRAVLRRAGQSLDDAGLAGPAVARWHALLTETEASFGSAHPETLAARVRLARACQTAGQPTEAVALYERAVDEHEHELGGAHPETVVVRAGLGEAYLAAGRFAAAAGLYQRTLEYQEQVFGRADPETVITRLMLARVYRAAGRAKDAITVEQRFLTDLERTAGDDHPDTLAVRGSLACSYHMAGRRKEAVALFRRVLDGRLRAGGPADPGTLTARVNLATACCAAGDLKAAVPLFEEVLADAEGSLGADHPIALAARSGLAVACHKAKRLPEAVALYERAAADCQRLLGPAHPETLTALGNLAHAYHTSGRLNEALPLFDATVADCARFLGDYHPVTPAVQELRRRYMAGQYGAVPIIASPVP